MLPAFLGDHDRIEFDELEPWVSCGYVDKEVRHDSIEAAPTD